MTPGSVIGELRSSAVLQERRNVSFDSIQGLLIEAEAQPNIVRFQVQ